MIVAAAIKLGDLVCSMPQPARHADILRQISGLYWDRQRHSHTYETEVQGFLDDEGQFLDRRAAYQHCLDNTQRIGGRDRPNSYQGEELYSEDLW
ncbi:MAG: hypothetical protein EOO28_34680 [Comamonadaceae bacterium]|nr:MAG: hypothetical protein EOO28_34680 [Comamonadaceae bacterium]